MSMDTEIIAALDAIAGLGDRNYSDQAPEKTVLPYTVLRTDISDTPRLAGDGIVLATTRVHQLDVWEARSAEDEALRLAIIRKLDNLKLSDCYKLSWRSTTRVPDPNYDLLHRAITLAATQKVIR